MASLKFTVHTNIGEKLASQLGKASTETEHAVAIQVLKDTEPFVPASQAKSLSNRAQADGGYVIYPGPYARFLYYGKLMIDPSTGSSFAPKGASKVVTGTDLKFSKAVHSQAQAHWFEASKAQNLDKWIRLAKKEFGDDLKE